MNVRILSMCLFWLRRLAISGSAWHPRALWALIRPPTVQLAEVGFMCLLSLHVRNGSASRVVLWAVIRPPTMQTAEAGLFFFAIM